LGRDDDDPDPSQSHRSTWEAQIHGQKIDAVFEQNFSGVFKLNTWPVDQMTKKDYRAGSMRPRSRFPIPALSSPGIQALVMLSCMTAFYISISFFWGGSSERCPKDLSVVTWNIAAVNNNPFEYWVTHQDPEYNKMMADVQAVMDRPGDHDVPVQSIITDAMFRELVVDMEQAGILGTGAAMVAAAPIEARWRNDLSQRRAISGFLADRRQFFSFIFLLLNNAFVPPNSRFVLKSS
jgi:hypothetical protein